MTITFEVPIAACGKARARATGSHHYTPLDTVAAQRTIAGVARRTTRLGNLAPLKCAVRLSVIVLMPPPKSATEEEAKAMLAGEIRPVAKPDWDNIGKLVSDALNGVAYADDKQIADGRTEKFYALRDMLHITVAPCTAHDDNLTTKRNSQ